MAEPVIIKFTADTSEVEAGIKRLQSKGAAAGESTEKAAQSAARATDGVNKGATQATGKIGRMAFNGFKAINGSAAKLGDTAAGLGESFAAAGKMGTAAIAGAALAAVGVIAGMLAKAAKAVWNFTKDAVKAADPVGFKKTMGTLTASINRMKSALGNILKPAFEGVASAIGGIADGISTVCEYVLIASAYMQGLAGQARNVGAASTEAGDALEGAAEQATEGLASFDKLNTLGDLNVSGLVESQRIADLTASAYADGQALASTIADTFSRALGGLTDVKGLTDAIGSAWDGVTSAVGGFGSAVASAWKSYTEYASQAWEAMTGVIKSAFEAVTRPIIDTISAIVQAIRDAAQAVSNLASGNIGGGILDGIGNALGGIGHALGFASGGVIAPNDPHLVLVGDNRREQEIISPLSTIKEAVVQAMGSQGQTSPIELTVKLDRTTLARQVYPAIVTEAARCGRPLY